MFARSLKIFQPTRPLRGATIMQPDKSKRVWISTHAPLAGRDMPCWLWGSRTKDISTHAPLAGRDKCHSGRRESRLQISTHAPLAGRDASQPRRPYLRRHFNPRAPCGARPSKAETQACGLNFNPRAPCGARLFAALTVVEQVNISTHAPLAGRDSGLLLLKNKCTAFQPTRPLRGATAKVYKSLCTFLR